MKKTELTSSRTQLFLPFLLTGIVIAGDQIIKLLILRLVEPYPGFPGYPVLGDFFRIIHTRNLGIAFSIGRSLPGNTRYIIFSILPIMVMAVIVFYYFKMDDLTNLQRWALAGILGGGTGNILDRFFRPEGVVDFLDFKFFGLFGLDRWPTFNIADSSVVVCGFILVISFLVQEGKRKDE